MKKAPSSQDGGVAEDSAGEQGPTGDQGADSAIEPTREVGEPDSPIESGGSTETPAQPVPDAGIDSWDAPPVHPEAPAGTGGGFGSDLGSGGTGAGGSVALDGGVTVGSGGIAGSGGAFGTGGAGGAGNGGGGGQVGTGGRATGGSGAGGLGAGGAGSGGLGVGGARTGGAGAGGAGTAGTGGTGGTPPGCDPSPLTNLVENPGFDVSIWTAADKDRGYGPRVPRWDSQDGGGCSTSGSMVVTDRTAFSPPIPIGPPGTQYYWGYRAKLTDSSPGPYCEIHYCTDSTCLIFMMRHGMAPSTTTLEWQSVVSLAIVVPTLAEPTPYAQIACFGHFVPAGPDVYYDRFYFSSQPHPF